MEKQISYKEFEEMIRKLFLQGVRDMKEMNDDMDMEKSVDYYKSTIDEGLMMNVSDIIDGIEDEEIEKIIG